MTPLMRWCTAVWALVALVVLAFVDVPLVRWLLVVPVLLVGPGVVAARFVAPDDGRLRPAIALVAGLASLVLVSEAFALGNWFSVESVAAVTAALVVVGAVSLPVGSRAVTPLPPREPIDPRSPAAARLRHMGPKRWPVTLGSEAFGRQPVEAHEPALAGLAATGPDRPFVAAAATLTITSPTLGVLVEADR